MSCSPEKPGFTQTCSLFSQYLKEKGRFGDLTLGMTCNVEANGNPEMLRPCPTMNLFPVNEKSGGDCGRNVTVTRKSRSMDLFPNQAGFPSSSVPKDECPKRVDSNVTTRNKPAAVEPQAAQMTIFYAGQVIVFNDFPADKAKEIMLLAGKGNSQSNSMARSPLESGTGVPPTSNFSNIVTQGCVRAALRPNPGSDLPIARRASLHRFLEKRKDRITTREPYQIGKPAASPSKPADSKSWLGLAAQSPQ
ncbi:putative polygalacturonase-like [Hibiscus syriacus]|uniref:Protein TIFY n=1 Tax=Hibiscus syriacus TaxID=106335 RepID=A0A6A2WH97_HIBSY|nr:protein TIFY 10A-like [Hibiscus syriacus]KAE8658008.1 putative polygalacturonase-like [Hibiscus syriacus]